MSAIYFGAAAFILVMIALGLLRILRGAGSADRLMAAQIIGSGGVAVLLLLTGVGAILIGIAVAGKFIYDNWQDIKEMFAAFGEAFMAALGPVRPMLDPVISGVGSLFGWMSRLSLEIAPGTWRQWGSAAGAAVGDAVRWFAELPGRIAAAVGSLYELGRQMMQSFFDGIVSVANDLLNYVTGIGSRIRSALSFGSAEGVSSDPMGTGAIDGQRAKGGPISRGSTYLVGERGPELITAGRPGYVNKAGSFPVGGITVAPVFNMTFNGKTDSEDVVQQIRRVLRDEVRETFRGVFADTSMRFA